MGRIPFEAAAGVYGRSVATVLMLPKRYAAVGQMTQRIFEAVLAGCLPLAPADIRFADRFVPRELVVRSGREVLDRLSYLRMIAGTQQHAGLIAACVDRLRLFGLSKQIDTLESVLHGLIRPRHRAGSCLMQTARQATAPGSSDRVREPGPAGHPNPLYASAP